MKIDLGYRDVNPGPSRWRIVMAAGASLFLACLAGFGGWLVTSTTNAPTQADPEHATTTAAAAPKAKAPRPEPEARRPRAATSTASPPGDADPGIDSVTALADVRLDELTLVEAETGTPTGQSDIATNHGGFSGTGFIDYITTTGSGVVGLRTPHPTTGTANLVIRYSMGREGPDGDRSLTVIVNGTEQVQATFETTGAWAAWNEVTVRIEVNAGDNTIDLIKQADDTGWVNIDHIAITG